MKEKKKQENPFFNLLLNVVLPSFILIKFSKPEFLGPFWGLIIALAFPICYGIYDWFARKDFNVISLFGFISVLLTGGISLMELDSFWIIVKETSIPLLIALFILIFREKAEKFIAKMFLEILDEEKIEEKLSKKDKKIFLKKSFSKTTKYVVFTFLLSAFLNFTLAYVLINSEPGTVEYNAEIGKMTALSFPLIALPSTAVLIFVIFRLINNVKKKTGLNLEEIVKKVN